MSVTLSNDIYLIIFGHLNIEDILNVRLICREFYELSKLRAIWDSLIHKHVVEQDIPIPGLGGRMLNSLTAQELEESLHRALKLRRNWVSGYPLIKRTVLLDAVPNSHIVSLHFLPGDDDRRLVSLSMTSGHQRTFILRCWDLRAPDPVCIARRELLHYAGMAVNKLASGVGRIAVLNPTIEILSLHLEATNPDEGFVTSAMIPAEMSTIHMLSDSWIVTRDTNVRLYLWDINNPEAKLELQNNATRHQLIDVVITEKFLVALKITTVEFYALPSSIPAGPIHAIVHPIFVYRWPWRIDSAVMVARHGSRSNQESMNRPITIFMRFGSFYPWATNALHHYELRSNTFFVSSSPLSSVNLPYEFPPILRDTIASPVRLHATSDLAMGPYGTAIWTDSHTEDYFNHADRGQRVAGKLSPTSYGSREDDEETQLSDQIATSKATSVYAYHEQDSWVRIALDEAEGKIILGRDDGFITVLEYVPCALA